MDITKKGIYQYFEKWQLDQKDRNYLFYHLARYQFLLETIKNLLSSPVNKNKKTILDIGPSFQTLLMQDYFPKVKVNAMGKPFSHSLKAPKNIIKFDLNTCLDKKNWPKTHHYDVVVMTEVMEYLFIPPEYVFQFVESLLKPGGFFILQVSNGISLAKRINFLLGNKSCGKIIDKGEDKVHLREYTLVDLIKLGDNINFKKYQTVTKNYYSYSSLNIPYKLLMHLLQINQRLNEGITIVYQKPKINTPHLIPQD